MRGHGRRGDAEALGECKPGDAGTIAADAGVVREQAAHTDLQCEAERRGSAERADDDDVARADITGAAGDRVENDDAAAGIVIDGTQGAPLPRAPIITQAPRRRLSRPALRPLPAARRPAARRG